ncbi:MAG: HAD hydrolase-like protein [Actinomycetota bacterium]|nr:HAD hydrolase-like protein [Actinomycetota bacterium]
MRHVIWDWNGTLVDDLPIVVEAVNESLSVLGEGPIDSDGYREHYTRPVQVFYDRLLGRTVTDDEWHQIDGTFHAAYDAALTRVSLTPDAEEAVAIVAAAGKTQSILSMWWHDDLVPEVARHGLDRFMVRVDGNTKSAGETKERLLQIHLRDVSSATDDTVMIGDALDDGLAAMSLGVPCVLYDGGSHHRAELEALDVPVASSLLEAASIALGTT